MYIAVHIRHYWDQTGLASQVNPPSLASPVHVKHCHRIDGAGSFVGHGDMSYCSTWTYIVGCQKCEESSTKLDRRRVEHLENRTSDKQTASATHVTHHTHASPESVRRDVRPELCFYDARVSVRAGDAAMSYMSQIYACTQSSTYPQITRTFEPWISRFAR